MLFRSTPIDQDILELVAAVVAIDGSRAVRTVARGSRDQAAKIGERAALQLVAEGASQILEEARRSSRSAEGVRGR